MIGQTIIIKLHAFRYPPISSFEKNTPADQFHPYENTVKVKILDKIRASGAMATDGFDDLEEHKRTYTATNYDMYICQILDCNTIDLNRGQNLITLPCAAVDKYYLVTDQSSDS